MLFNVGNQNTSEGTKNTAVGTATLLFNNTGNDNTAVGAAALLNNTSGVDNTASGADALGDNTTGSFNTATGSQALFANTIGTENTANGTFALSANTEGSFNTALRVRLLMAEIHLIAKIQLVGEMTFLTQQRRWHEMAPESMLFGKDDRISKHSRR